MGSPQPRHARSKLEFNKWIRLCAATITSTALVGGTLVAVPAHPLNPITQVAEAVEVANAAPISAAEGLLIELNLLEGFVTPESRGAFNELLTVIEAEQKWENSDDTDQLPERRTLNLALLHSIQLDLGLIQIPLVGDGTNGGLLNLGTDGVGVLDAYAWAPNATTSHAAAGAITQDGVVNADSAAGSGNVETSIQVTALLDQLGLGNITDIIADDLSLRLGAVSSAASAEDGEITAEYAVANAELSLHSPLLEDVGGLLQVGTIGGDIDNLVETLLGNESALLGPLLQLLRALPLVNNVIDVGDISVTTNIEAALRALLLEPLESDLVSLDLTTGSLKVNLEELHSGNLSDLDPNTPLVNDAQLIQIVDEVDDLLEELVAKIENTVNDGVLDTTLKVSLGINAPLLGSLASLNIDGTLRDILAGSQDTIKTGGLFSGLDFIVSTLAGTIGGILGEYNAEGDFEVTIASNLVGSLTSGLTTLLSEGNGLGAVINKVLGEVLQVTINEQSNALVPARAGTRPNSNVGAATDPNLPFDIAPVSVNVLGLGTGGGVLTLPLARSTVTAAEASFDALYIPAYESTTIDAGTQATIDPPTFDSIATDAIETDPAPADTSYEAGTDFPEWASLNEDGSITVEDTAPVGSHALPVTVIYADGTSDEVEAELIINDTNAPSITNPGDQYGIVGTAIDPIEIIVTDDSDFTVQVDGLPGGVTYNPDTGEITGTPAPGTEGTYTVTIAATDADDNEAFEEFIFTVTSEALAMLHTPIYIQSTVIQGQTYTVPAPFDALAGAGIPEGTVFTSTGSPLEWADVNEDGTITLTPGADIEAKQYAVPVTATYLDGSTDTMFAPVVVRALVIPHIGENGNWYVGDTDTGVKATGNDGQDGAAGSDGQDGADGKNAYELWTEIDGNEEKTVEEFLESLVGENGESPRIVDGYWWIGDTNTQVKAEGEQGQEGATGNDGANGKSAYELWIEAGNTGTEEDFFDFLIGDKGEDGKSAYDLWIDAGNTGTEEEFLASLKGDKGDTGEDGQDGAALTIINHTTNPDTNITTLEFSDGTTLDIPAGLTGAPGLNGEDGEDGTSITITSNTTDDAGNTTLVFSDGNTIFIPAGATGQDGADGAALTITNSALNDNGDLVITFSDDTTITIPKGATGADGAALTITNETTDDAGNTVITFSDGTTITIAKGDKGDTGEDGQDGLSAFELWLEAGNDGDINDFLDSLKGEDGIAGTPGANGQSAYELWIEAGNTGTEEDFLLSLIGDKGEDGKSAYDLWIDAGNTGTEEEFLASLKGDKGDTGEDGQDGTDGQDGQDGLGSSIGGGSGSSSGLAKCIASPTGGSLAILAALGMSAAVLNGPLLQPIARTLGAQINAEAAKFSSRTPGSSQPDWLVQINRGIEQAAKSVDTKVILPALLGAGVIAALFFSDDCGPSGSSN